MKKEYKGKKSEGGGGGLVPEDDYKLKIIGEEWTKTKKGDGHYLSVEFESKDKKAGKRHFWHNFNLDNPNEKTVEIAEEQLENLMYCCGVDSLKMKKTPSIEPLFGSLVMAHIIIEEPTKKQKKKFGWEDRNHIKYFFEVEDEGGADDLTGKKKDKKKDKSGDDTGKKGKKGKKDKKGDDPF